MKVRVLYRSREVQYPLLAAMRASDAWTRAGLDTGGPVPYVAGANDGDELLARGDVDFIFGSHVTPYLRYDEGVPFVYLGQTVNVVDDVLVSRLPLRSVAELAGRTVGDRLSGQSHTHGNRILYLAREGLAEHDVTWVETRKADMVDHVHRGIIDAAFVAQPHDHAAEVLGLHVLRLEPMPMVMATTVTTLWPKVAEDPELCRRVLRAVRIGVAFYQDEKAAMWEVMKDDVGPELGISSEDVLRRLYERNAAVLDRSLYPGAEAVHNAFRLAVRQRPGLERRMSPLALWDTHLLRELDAAGH